MARLAEQAERFEDMVEQLVAKIAARAVDVRRATQREFGRGDPVAITGPSGETVATGLARYTADEVRRIAGNRSDQIEAILGYTGRAALVHRDDMAL